MKITLRKLVEGWESLQKLAQIDASKGLTITQAWLIGKVYCAVEIEIKQLEELRSRLFASYGETVGQERHIKAEHIASFTAQIEELLDQPLDLPVTKIPISALNPDLPLSARDLIQLDWLLEE